VADEREDVAAELARVREEARAAASPAAPAALPPPALREPPPLRREPPPPAETAPSAPDAAAVNASWPAESRPPGGLVARILERLLRVRLEAQRAFNADQVRLDNAVLHYVEERFAATHRHYDRLLEHAQRRQDEIDERHVLLERELVAHVQDLVRRIDLVLAESGRGRAGLELSLEDVRARLTRLEEALRRRP
jgi:hypothetical protein